MRPSLEEMYLQIAAVVSLRSTCSRKAVGVVITDWWMTDVWAIGYNGNCRGLANTCDRPEEKGNCGCVHAEQNALLKAPYREGNLVLFSTDAPCVPCAKTIINSQVHRVVFRKPFWQSEGLVLLQSAGIITESLPSAYPALTLSK